MTLFKTVIIFSSLILSLNVFACRPSSQMAGSLMPVNGIMTKISTTKKFNNFKFMSIAFAEAKYIYKVILKNDSTKTCLKVLMTATSNGMCKYSVTINKMMKVTCK